MGKLSLKDKVCLLTSWALVLMFGAAEHDYFPQTDSFTWEEARNHCQVCFEDLVTLTSENTRTIAVNLTSDYWVGLRKNLNLTSNSTMFWSRWANGDPLAFQNWYPGWPVLKAPSPEPVCCSCSCTCPTRTTSPTYSSTLSGAMTTFSRPTESTDFSVSSSGTDEGTQESTSSEGQTATGPTVTDQTAAGQTASDQTAAGQTATGPTASDQTAAGPTATGQTAAGPTATGQTASDQTAAGQTASEQTVAGQTASDQTAAGQTASDQTVTGPTVAGQTAAGQTAPDQTVTGPTVAGQTASGQTASDQTAAGQTASDQTAAGQTASGQTASDQTAAGQTASDQTVAGPTVAGPTVTGPTVAGQTVTGPTVAGQTASDQTAAGQTAAGQTASDQMATGPTVTRPTPTGPTATGPTVTRPTSTGPTVTRPTAPGPLVAECVRSPMLSPMLSSILSPNISNVSNASNASNVSNTDQNYIEDSCVAMLSFGAWVEKNCLERLPFICYEVRFIGKVNASNVTTQSAILSWERGPGSIRHYRLEVTGDREERRENQTDLTATLGNLTAGTRYSVKVFPVKCQRDLNPQTVVFYTIPNKVDNLRADDPTESSVTLSWDKPSGGVDFYVVKFNDQLKNVRANSTVVKELTPGSTYTFSIVSAVDSETTRSEESNITVFTRPGKVSKLTVSENSDTSLKLSWKPPSGQFKDFRVTAMNVINIVLFNETTTQKEAKVTNLPVGSNITLSVTARASHGLEGDSVSTVGHTTPGPVSNLTLVPESDYINATWNFPAGTVPTFKITLQLDGEVVQTHKQQESEKTFTGLKNAANYTVTVRITSGELESPAVSKSTYTKPASPRNLRVAFSNQSQITLKWDAPANTAAVSYSVKLSSRFWGHYFSENVKNLNHTFDALKSGSRYEAEVQTVVGNTSSSVERLCPYTDANKIEISLAMLCSSKEALLCDKATTRDRVFEQLQKHFHNKLQNFVLWELKKPN